jgi:hypothetical protein
MTICINLIVTIDLEFRIERYWKIGYVQGIETPSWNGICKDVTIITISLGLDHIFQSSPCFRIDLKNCDPDSPGAQSLDILIRY